MPTRLSDITGVASSPTPRPQAQGQESSPPDASLPLDTCGGCEWARFGMLAGADPGDTTIGVSPDARRHDRDGTEQSAAYRCRYCGRVVRRGEADGKVTA
jgi:hypothetical protein